MYPNCVKSKTLGLMAVKIKKERKKDAISEINYGIYNI